MEILSILYSKFLENWDFANLFQFKSVRGLGAELPVGGVESKAPHEGGGLGGQSSPGTKKMLNVFFPNFFCSDFDEFFDIFFQ